MSDGKSQIERLMQILNTDKVFQLAELLGEKQNTISTWKTRGIPHKKIIEASRIVGCSPLWLHTGEGEMFLPETGPGEAIKPAKLFEAWDFLCQVEQLRREPFQEKQKIELLAFVYNKRAKDKPFELEDLNRKIKEIG